MKKCETPLAYYTRAFDHTEIRIHTREKHATSGPAKLFLGRVEMESRVKSFKRFWKSQDVQQDPEVELSLPSWGYCTRGLWFEDPVGIARRPAALKREAEASSESAQSGEQWQWGCGWAGAHAAMHALLHVIPLFVLADRRDLDAACVDEHETPPMEACLQSTLVPVQQSGYAFLPVPLQLDSVQNLGRLQDHPRLMIFDAKDEARALCRHCRLHSVPWTEKSTDPTSYFLSGRLRNGEPLS